ncbi:MULTISPECIES: YDG/SRA domain-containing protein [unclassified Streptomyces]|uniref:YDG/SRA domain-containing protein n=1 Tax=unclassified Streptomyces TaxID=2593676 RepID=UPI002DDAF17B|nr:YDG/SRA domain-containing protein [Streptomyces sp. NBC_01750]WSB02626.1 HNH endonuclease [Streptomyces sp. NBC_01794]WSD33101.1 HNH endonuclease [Streptomyces sp. NBC_01750]
MASESKQVMFGTPDGVSEGDWFKGHNDLHAVGLHRFLGRGISGTAKTGADSIVLSGGYIDDKDDGAEIIYTGEGGRDRDTGHMVADQSLTDEGNAALVVSQGLGYPVRVIEGLEIKGKTRRRATGGYRYRGLYQVADHWITNGQEGFRICRFKLLKLAPGEEAKPQSVDPDAGEDTDLEEEVRRYVAHNRLARDSKVAREIKALHNNTCQICGLRLVISPMGEAYAEAAHIQALGKPHFGRDRVQNVLCLCPNCHTRFDRGALHITDEFKVIDSLTGKFVSELRRIKSHNIGVEFIQKHRARWQDRSI